jgi:aminoglycoside 6'-N-acetyltransferase
MITLRPATIADIPTLDAWDREPHVISATTDAKDADVAFGDHDWQDELSKQSDVFQYYIAELDGRPLGGMLIIDPHLEPSHYWGEIEPNLRAVDIWIGASADLGKGYGETMMRLAFQLCFADPNVKAIVIDPLASNTRAHKFYQRLGFKAEHRQTFGEDDCLVHRLTRQDWRRVFPAD